MVDDDSPTPSRRGRARALDEDQLDEIQDRNGELPEPLAMLGLEIQIARDEDDPTGVRKRLYELSAAVARYAVSIGLAAFAQASGGAASGQLAEALDRAVKLTDGRWLELARVLRNALRRVSPAAAKLLAFAEAPALGAMVASRNEFIHGGGTGDDAPARTLGTLDAAAGLLGVPLRVAVAREPPTTEIRHGVPRRRGVYKKGREEQAAGLEPGAAFVLLEGAAIPVDPWLPTLDGSLVLLDSPRAAGRPWRCIAPDTGEHRDHPALDAAVRRLVGVTGSAPRPPVDRPRLVGRETEASLARRALEEASGGHVRVALLSGPHGVGCSRMLAEIAGAAVAQGFTSVLAVRGSLDRRAPFGALRAALEETSGGPLLELRDAIERVLTTENLAVRAGLEAQLEALEEQLVGAARRTSIVVTVDDAQWLDDHTLTLLRLLVERATRGAEGALAIFIAAPDDPRAAEGLGRLGLSIDRDVGAGATRIPLGPLGPSPARALVDGVAPVTPVVRERLVRGAAGAPFLLVQPLLVWIETGTLEWEGAAWAPPPALGPAVLDAPIPGLAEAVDAHVAGLAERGSDAERVAHRVLACVAADDAATPARVLAVLARLGIDGALASRMIDALLDAGILSRSEGCLRHPQPLVAEALAARYRARADAEALERALLAVLAEEPPRRRDPERIARGLDRLGELEGAAVWYREALAQRLRQGAFAAAGALAERLASCEPTRAGRLRAELAAVDALRRNGQLLEAAERCAAIAPSAAPEVDLERRLVEQSLALARGLPAPGDLGRLVAETDGLAELGARVEARLLLASRTRGAAGRALLREALALLDRHEHDASDRRYRLCALDLELAYETREGGAAELRRAAARAEAAARELGSTWAELDVANDAAVLEADAGDLPTAIAAFADVAARAGAAHFGSQRRLALTNAAAMQLRAGNAEAARELARIAEVESRAAGDERFLAFALSSRAEAELLLGDAAASLAAVSEAIQIRERARDKAVAVALLRRADALELLGDPDGARHDAELALTRAREATNVDAEALARLWLARFALRRGAHGAREQLADLVRELDAGAAALRAPTRKRLEEARKELGGGPPSGA